MLLGIEDYPFHEMTDRYAFRVECRANWKVFSDAFMEFYHAPVVHLGQHPRHLRTMINEGGYEAPYYQIEGPHGVVTTAGSLHRGWEMPPENVKPADIATRSGLFGPWDTTDLGELPPGSTPAACTRGACRRSSSSRTSRSSSGKRVGTTRTRSGRRRTTRSCSRGTCTRVPAKSASERVGREMAAVAFKEYSLQDANTLEATQMGLEARRRRPVPAQRPGGAGAELPPGRGRLGRRLPSATRRVRRGERRWRLLPSEFSDLEPFAEKWCLATEPERWAQRMSSTMDGDAGVLRRHLSPCPGRARVL